MKIEQTIIFPCGYSFTMNINSPLSLGNAKFEFNEKTMPLCPLHGKKCDR